MVRIINQVYFQYLTFILTLLRITCLHSYLQPNQLPAAEENSRITVHNVLEIPHAESYK